MPVVESLTILAALMQPSGQTSVKGCRIGDLVHQDVNSWVFDSLADLDALLSDPDVPNEFRPTGHAYFNVRKRLLETNALVNQRPSITLDGEGGIDIEWEGHDRLLMLSCRARRDQRDYVYFEERGLYGGDDVSPIYLTDRLNWFLRG